MLASLCNYRQHYYYVKHCQCRYQYSAHHPRQANHMQPNKANNSGNGYQSLFHIANLQKASLRFNFYNPQHHIAAFHHIATLNKLLHHKMLLFLKILLKEQQPHMKHIYT